MSATVTKTVRIDDWINGEGKAVPKYKVELSDGRSGECFADVPSGTPDSDLTIEDKGKYGLKFKWNKKPSANGKAWGGGGAKSTINEGCALAYSKDIAVALIAKMDKAPKSEEIVKVITGMADTFYTWLESKKK